MEEFLNDLFYIIHVLCRFIFWSVIYLIFWPIVLFHYIACWYVNAIIDQREDND